MSTTADPGRWLYELLAPAYDRLSGEGTLYAIARARTIQLLHLRPGATVLDVACGTGRNHELIQERIGPSGRLVGLDRSPRMLQRARERAARQGWNNVELIETDVTNLTPELLDELGVATPTAGFDAVLCTLGLTVIPDWRNAWRAMLNLVHPGGRIAIMDAGYPDRPGQAGETVALRPVAWLLCRLFAAAPRRQPWQLVAKDTDNAVEARYTLGYIGVAAGTRSARGRPRGTPAATRLAEHTDHGGGPPRVRRLTATALEQFGPGAIPRASAWPGAESPARNDVGCRVCSSCYPRDASRAQSTPVSRCDPSRLASRVVRRDPTRLTSGPFKPCTATEVQGRLSDETRSQIAC